MTLRSRRMLGVASLVAIVLLLPACAAHNAPSTGATGARTTALQKEIVFKLAGASDIRPGVRIANRTTLDNKQEARAYLAGVLKAIGLEPKRQAYSAEGENVYAVLACGRPSAELVVLGAHYDSARSSPGANDDATGVAAVAAVAEQMVRVKRRTRDIAFVFFDEEERGLRGSRAFAQMLKDEKRAVNSVHTIDQMGWDQDRDRAFELEIPYEGAVELYASSAKAVKLEVVIRTTTEAGSDHSAFRRLGFRAVGITEEYRNSDTTPYIHRSGDTADTVDLEYLASTTRIVARAMGALVTGAAK